ncbi:hypothetical protein [Diaphorobacter caeni]|uniref:hypothetical protein n=1 Tax=Diaphorobacter caeni TaxID=2784387 RepID=UPI00188F981D|nr:hypothetical protein [Diaphorobacter caeni]MBF5005192.1 hypothetical protein [Diaphorobacter caeni]
MRFLKQCLLPALMVAAFSTPALAAREFTPQSGLWMIPSENNGQPGRGFSLDVQGNTAFLQVFNYEKSGAATFHTAVGQLDAAASMTVPLLRFKDGRYLGGPTQDAVEDGSAGDVTVTFSDGLNGTIQFPGEAVQPIARFLVPEKQPFWWTQVSESPPSSRNGTREMVLTATSANGARYAWQASLHLHDTQDKFQLSFYPTQPYLNTSSSEPPATLECQIEQSTQTVDCVPARTNVSGETSVDALAIQRMRFQFVGRDVVGFIQPAADRTSRLVVNGMTFSSRSSLQIKGLLEFTSKTYGVFDLMADACILSCLTMGDSHITILPTSGAWIIEAESQGTPGRGVFLDVQDETVIVQTSDYLPSGDATFHMGAGKLKSSATWAGDTTATMPLFRYGGGRYFGGPPLTGREEARAGDLTLAFSPQYGTEFTDFGTGDVGLPGESVQRIRRLQFEPHSVSMENMLGEYLTIWDKWEGTLQREERWVRLTRVDGDVAKNDDGTVQCKRNDSGQSGNYKMLCLWNESADAKYDPMKWWRRAEMEIHPFLREVAHSKPVLRTRDRHGNWLGLGAVSLPGLAIPQDQ